jgi:hypothetical protein
MVKFLLGAVSAVAIATATAAEEPTNLYWGDTHLHTSYSFDAFIGGNKTADPDTAYRWAKGQPVIHPYNRTRVQLSRPLDFLVVADHAELMGTFRGIYMDDIELPELGPWDSFKRWISVKVLKSKIDDGTAGEIFYDLLPKPMANPGGDPVTDPNNRLPGNPFGDPKQMEQVSWNEIVDAAERHNDPGNFTSFIGWEWSSIPSGSNLHRIVMSPDGGETAKKYLPYGSDDSQYPQDLWAWLEKTKADTGADFIAIPHNSNISKGYMFQETTLKGAPITSDYAQTRIQWEPVAEITQIKGDSETHPTLSPDDEFADFETYGFFIQQSEEDYDYKAKKGDYIRAGLRTGLKLESAVGTNPYKFGVIGSTDSHSGLSSADEGNFWGKMARDSTPENKASFGIGKRPMTGWNMSAQGLAAVWAEANNRDAIFNAFKRKEVYGTTGPRMRVRFFAGWDFDALDAQKSNVAEVGYKGGVPMGGDLVRPTNGEAAPQLLIQATKDPAGANLDRVQVVKGWLTPDGETHEKVFDVAWAGERAPDANGKLPAVGDTVNRGTGSVANSIGTPELITVWTDPTFDADQRAFYYVRVLQIPTARHSLLDAVALQEDAAKKGPEVIQERAYTSPIWYTP